MKDKLSRLCLVSLLVYLASISAAGSQSGDASVELPALETFILEGIELESAGFWVPAAKAGPVVNRACRGRSDSFFSVLAAGVQHTKRQVCPEEVARLLAEYAARYHERSMPLTIFNGWQWEYSYSLCQFESVTFDLPAHGGSWESAWEAILTQTVGGVGFEWLRVPAVGEGSAGGSMGTEPQSRIEVKTFSSMRVRDGYPKKRQLE